MMNTTLHLIIPWLIVISAALVCLDKKHRFVGAVILVSQGLYSTFRIDIKIFANVDVGAFNAIYDLATAIILIKLSQTSYGVTMGLILCLFVFVHSLLGISVDAKYYSIFWSQHVTFILGLNLLQLFYFSKGVKDAIRKLYDDALSPPSEHEFVRGSVLGYYRNNASSSCNNRL